MSGEAKHALRALAALVAVLIFLAALAYPAVGTCAANGGLNRPNWFDNTTILFFGWLAVFAGQFGWFANVPFFLNVAGLLRDRHPHRIVPIAQAFLLFVAIVTLRPASGLRLPHNEAFDEPLCYLGVGFWMWVVAQSIVLAASFAAQRQVTAERSAGL